MNDRELIKRISGNGASEQEIDLLMYISDKYKLDPLLKEIWCIKRSPKENAIIMTSRDGYLKIAHTSDMLDGLQSGTMENEKGELVKAWCEIWRKDMSHSFKSEVKFSEYRQNNFIWQKYPSAMLIKVAEVFALKRAFSISGMLTTEEMGDEYQPPKNPNPEKTEDEKLQEAFTALIEDIKKVKTEKEFNELKLKERYEKAMPKLSKEHGESLTQWLEQLEKELDKEKAEDGK